ncbi:MaoC family dehydratase [Cytophagaceae bacterium ABcell3]|nr:MaoC family dehydratase [Cytophagaceae bacterium ABcell3]
METGQCYSEKFSFSQEDVIRFAELSGDKNPIHLDNDFASTTIFKKPIIHGVLGISVFSKILGVKFPGQGTIIMKQEISFKRPLFVGHEYEASISVSELYKERSMAVLEAKVLDTQTGKINMTGTVHVINKEKIM